MTVTRRLHATIVAPLVVLATVVTVITARGLSTNSTELESALVAEGNANHALSLFLAQEGASKSMLIDPERFDAYAVQRLEAYDAHRVLLHDLASETDDPEVRALVERLRALDTETLHPLDERIVESLQEDPEAARRLYFEAYEPSHRAYASAIGELVDRARERVRTETLAADRENLRSLVQIVVMMAMGVAGVALTIELLGGRVDAAQNRLMSLLRGMDEGLFYFDREGRISEYRSQALREILPGSDEILSMTELVGRYSTISPASVPTTLAMLWGGDDGFYSPFEATVTLLPKDLVLPDGRTVRLLYRPGAGPTGALERVYVSARDVTNELAAEAETRAMHERADQIASFAAEPDRFVTVSQEIDRLFAQIRATLDSGRTATTTLKRDLHTLKGSTAMEGFRSVSAELHRVEDALARDDGAAVRDGFERALADWTRTAAELRRIVRADDGAVVRRVPVAKIAELRRLAATRGDLELAARLEALDRRPLGDLIGRYRRYTAELAARGDGPPPEVVVADASDEATPAELEVVDALLSHLIRNAIDHGIEPPDRRGLAGKPPEGRISIGLERRGDELWWTFADDGAGIAADRLADRMVATGRWDAAKAASATWEEKVRLVFESGLSSRMVITDTSGRGVGMDAVKSLVEALEGWISVSTVPGVGTEILLAVPTWARAPVERTGRRSAPGTEQKPGDARF